MDNQLGPTNFQVTSEYRDLLIEVAAAYILESPPDFIDFAVDYFKEKLDERRRSVETFERHSSSSISSGEVTVGRRVAIAGEGMDDDDEEDAPTVVYPKKPEQQLKLANIIKEIIVFQSVDRDGRDKLIDAMMYKSVSPDEYVIKQGESGDYFYAIDHGYFEAILEHPDGETLLHSYVNEGSFGELSLLYNVPRACSVKAISRGALWALDRQTFRKIVLKRSLEKRKMFEGFLANVPLLKGLSPYERMNLADALETRTFSPGQLIIKQGEDADGMYFVEEGIVRVTASDRSSGPEMVLKTIEPEGYFGELALLKHKKRAANVYAVTDVKLAFLHGEAFERLLGPCVEVMRRNTVEYKKPNVK